MPNVLLRGTSVIRHSTLAFSVSASGATCPDGENLAEAGLTTVATYAAIPNDFEPWKYTWNGAAFVVDGSYVPPTAPVKRKDQFATLTPTDLVSLVVGALQTAGAADGMARMDELWSKSKTIEILVNKAEKVDRMKGNTPAALAKLMQGPNKLTQAELDAIDAAWAKK